MPKIRNETSTITILLNIFFYSLELVHKDSADIFALPVDSLIPPLAESGGTLGLWWGWQQLIKFAARIHRRPH